MTDEIITERKDGVTVRVETKRGTGTRDQDKVSVTAHFDDLEEAFNSVPGLNALAAEHAKQMRLVQPETEESENE